VISVERLDAMVRRALERAAVARLRGDNAELVAELRFAVEVREIEARYSADVLAGLEADLLERPGP
jgi:hypothetical protein